jgi:hypothetical protein
MCSKSLVFNCILEFIDLGLCRAFWIGGYFWTTGRVFYALFIVSIKLFPENVIPRPIPNTALHRGNATDPTVVRTVYFRTRASPVDLILACALDAGSLRVHFHPE